MTKYLNVGKTVSTQGIKGEIHVISTTSFPEERYKKGTVLTLFQDGKVPIELTAKSHRKHKNFDLLSFESHPSINDVEKYRDGTLKVLKDNSADLDENESYYHEIIGLHVMEEDRMELGKVREILSSDANDIRVTQRPKKADILLPYITSVVKEVDLEAGVIRVEIPGGLIDSED